jgi:hypothetical protein
MTLQIIANQEQIVAAINGFPDNYHQDFFRVRALARTYLAEPQYAVTVDPLSHELRRVLANWGAGRREAPQLQPFHQFQAVLMDPDRHALLSELAVGSLTTLSLVGGKNRLVGGIGTSTVLSAFDSNLLRAFNALSVGLFVKNTNVTYPMKALLLITGFMPALDSQVRKGLGKGGFVGCNKTQFLIPPDTDCADGKKVSRLPFYLADGYMRHSALINRAVAASNYPVLATEVGRLFDVLFFMQADLQPILELQPGDRDWYNLA